MVLNAKYVGVFILTNKIKKTPVFVLDEVIHFLHRWTVTSDDCENIMIDQAMELTNFIIQIITDVKQLEKLRNDKI